MHFFENDKETVKAASKMFLLNNSNNKLRYGPKDNDKTVKIKEK